VVFNDNGITALGQIRGYHYELVTAITHALSEHNHTLNVDNRDSRFGINAHTRDAETILRWVRCDTV
jgi:hypothetical protein